MGTELELVSDGSGLAVIGEEADIERFFLSAGLDKVPSHELDLHRLASFTGTGGAVAKVGTDIMANHGRWVKVTADSAEKIKQIGLMPTKTPGVSHAMIGKPGEIKSWVQISSAPTALLSGPFALAALSTMMQQRAMQQQMDEIVDYLQEIDEKVDDILRGQKDAVLADMIGVDLVIDEALTVRDQVGRVSEVTWSKVQATELTIARTQAYALRQLDAIAEKIEKKAKLGDISRATKQAVPEVRDWLAVIARTVQLQDGIAVLELDRILDASPEDLMAHRAGLMAARQSRLDLLLRSTDRILTQTQTAVQRANSKVLFNPFDSPSIVRSSNEVTGVVREFSQRLGIESSHETADAKRWSEAAAEARDKAIVSASGGATAAAHFGSEVVGRTSGAFRAVDIDGDGIPDKSPAAAAAEDAGVAVKNATSHVARVLGKRIARKHDVAAAAENDNPEMPSDES